MKHELPKLLYAYDALEPYIDARTMEIHYAKHHQAYVNKLNEALAKHSELEVKTIEELLKDLEAVPEDVRMAVRNHGGGHYNHSLFWDLMAPFDATQGTWNGPGKLTKALGINGLLNGRQADKTSGLWIEDRGIEVRASSIRRMPRIGVAYAKEWAKRPYRFVLHTS